MGKKSLFKVRRRKKISSFSARDKMLTSVNLALLFFLGLYISSQYLLHGIVIYILLWILSYFVIYAGTCRYCANYGKPCPIPFEGSLVSKFFEKKNSGFGTSQLLWAGVSYLMRIIVPMYLIFATQSVLIGIVYFVIFLMFMYLHQQVVGCPNCVNSKCPFNPDFK